MTRIWSRSARRWHWKPDNAACALRMPPMLDELARNRSRNAAADKEHRVLNADPFYGEQAPDALCDVLERAGARRALLSLSLSLLSLSSGSGVWFRFRTCSATLPTVDRAMRTRARVPTATAYTARRKTKPA